MKPLGKSCPWTRQRLAGRGMWQLVTRFTPTNSWLKWRTTDHLTSALYQEVIHHHSVFFRSEQSKKIGCNLQITKIFASSPFLSGLPLNNRRMFSFQSFGLYDGRNTVTIDYITSRCMKLRKIFRTQVSHFNFKKWRQKKSYTNRPAKKMNRDWKKKPVEWMICAHKIGCSGSRLKHNLGLS